MRLESGSRESQLAAMKTWLDARGGKWTRGLAMAALEPWVGRAEVARPGQEQQLEWATGNPIPMVPDLQKPARGDLWLLIGESVDGGAVEVPESSPELAKEVRRRWLKRAAEKAPVPPIPRLPSFGGLLTWGLIALVIHELVTHKGDR